MRFLKILLLGLAALLLSDSIDISRFSILVRDCPVSNGQGDNECSIMVISGRATVDGRPILWKNRDVTEPNQCFRYVPARATHEGTTYSFIGNFYTNNAYRCYMGVNETGFAIINANCYNLPDDRKDGLDDGDIMRLALEWCSSVEDWEELLAVTSTFGRKDGWMFGAMDASGAAKLYECGNSSVVAYDANDSLACPRGYIIRSVFGLSGWFTTEGLKRYNRVNFKVDKWFERHRLDVKYILQYLTRDFSFAGESNSADDPYPLPYYGYQDNLPKGFVNTFETINRYKTRSCAVIRGVLPDEDPHLATTFAMLGQPVASIAVPLWVGAEAVPSALSLGNPVPWYAIIHDRMGELYPLNVPDSDMFMNTHCLLDTNKTGIYTWSLPTESEAYDEAEQNLIHWRNEGFSTEQMRTAQNDIFQRIWDVFEPGGEPRIIVAGSDEVSPKITNLHNYPNPFNSNTVISFQAPAGTDPRDITVNIYSLLGERVISLKNINFAAGIGNVVWNGRNTSDEQVAAGVYMYRVESSGFGETGKMIYLK